MNVTKASQKMNMRAARFHRTGPPEVLQIEDVPIPAPGAGDVLVRVEAAGVNYADVVRRRGDFYPVPTPLPHISGSEFVGRIEAVGEGVDPALRGTRVLGSCDGGAYAEYVSLPGQRVYEVPEDIDAAAAAALFVQGLTAALTLKESGALKPGGSVFVEGAAGGVGSLALQLARLYGASLVVAGAGSEAKRAFAQQLGADAAVDYMRTGWAAEVRQATGGRGVDVALEMTGGDTLLECLDALAPGGRMIVYGAASGTLPAVPVEQLMKRGAGVQAFFLGAHIMRRPLIEPLLAELFGWLREGRLSVHVGGRFPLARAAEAHSAIESRATTGKLVVLP